VEHDVARGKVDLAGMNFSPDSPFASLLTTTRRLVPEVDTEEEEEPSQWKA
jgi:hypothetical protein